MVEPPDGAFETAAGGSKGAKPEVPPPKAATAKERGGRGRPKAIDVAVAAAAIEANEAGGESDNSTTEKGDFEGPKSDVAEPKEEEEEENEKENQVTQPTHDFYIADKDNQVILSKVFSYHMNGLNNEPRFGEFTDFNSCCCLPLLPQLA